MSDPDYSGLYKHICSNNVMTVPMKTNYFKHVFCILIHDKLTNVVFSKTSIVYFESINEYSHFE